MADVSTFLQCSWLLAALACLLPPVMARFFGLGKGVGVLKVKIIVVKIILKIKIL